MVGKRGDQWEEHEGEKREVKQLTETVERFVVLTLSDSNGSEVILD